MDEIDKTSTSYFMTQMTQGEFEELTKKYRPSSYVKMGCETGWTRDERYLLNKIRMKQIEDLESQAHEKINSEK